MDEHLQTLEHAQKTIIDLAIQAGSKRISADDDHGAVPAIVQAVRKTFRAHRISIPFPQREVRLPSAA